MTTEERQSHKETHALFVGSHGSGKTTLIQHFLGKDGATSKTPTALDYQFARRQKSLSSGKEVANIWELGGSVFIAGLMGIPLRGHLDEAVVVIVLDLSQPENVLPSLKHWLEKINLEIRNTPQTSAGEARGATEMAKEPHCDWFGDDHPDLKAIDRFPVPLMIAANKYDIFKNSDSVQRKSLTQALRCAAHAHGASLVFASTKDRVARDNFRTMSRQLLFSRSVRIQHPLGRKRRMKQIQNDGPIMVCAGKDSFNQIMGSSLTASDCDIVSSKCMPYKSLDHWITTCASIFGKHTLNIDEDEVCDEVCDEQEAATSKLDYKEPLVDEARAAADRRLASYRMEKKRIEAIRTSADRS